MEKDSRLLTEEEVVLGYLAKCKELRFSSMVVQVADGRVVYVEVIEKVRL